MVYTAVKTVGEKWAMAMKIDPRFAKSNGWFKDPFTLQDFTGEEERVQTCKPGGPFVYPMIKLSNGEAVKLSFKLWNADEKACYKEVYKSGNKPKKQEPKKQEPEHTEPVTSETYNEVTENIITYNGEATATPETLAIIANCDRCIGVVQICGVTYALLTAGKITHYVPRCLIKDEYMQRLCHD